MRPSVGCSNPAIRRREVVLPEPEGPSIEKNSPSRTSRSTPSTAVTSPKRLTTLSRRTATGGPASARAASTVVSDCANPDPLTVWTWAILNGNQPAGNPEGCPDLPRRWYPEVDLASPHRGREAGCELPKDPRPSVDEAGVDLHGGGASAQARQGVLGGGNAAARRDRNGAAGRGADLGDDPDGVNEERPAREPPGPHGKTGARDEARVRAHEPVGTALDGDPREREHDLALDLVAEGRQLHE